MITDFKIASILITLCLVLLCLMIIDRIKLGDENKNIRTFARCIYFALFITITIDILKNW